MRVVAVNTSPRPNWNTGKLLEAALEAVQAQGAETALVQTSALHFTGCRSCFACKRAGVPIGHCVIKDDLQPVLENILSADVLLLGTPIYFGDVTAAARALLERLWFPSLNYDKERTVNYPLNLACGLLFTMNVAKTELYDGLYQQLSGNMARLVGPTQMLTVGDTLQFSDYSAYYCTLFDAEHKQKHHETVFPEDIKRAQTWAKDLLRLANTLKGRA